MGCRFAGLKDWDSRVDGLVSVGAGHCLMFKVRLVVVGEKKNERYREKTHVCKCWPAAGQRQELERFTQLGVQGLGAGYFLADGRLVQFAVLFQLCVTRMTIDNKLVTCGLLTSTLWKLRSWDFREEKSSTTQAQNTKTEHYKHRSWSTFSSLRIGLVQNLFRASKRKLLQEHMHKMKTKARHEKHFN
jgi:hypothetical protein